MKALIITVIVLVVLAALWAIYYFYIRENVKACASVSNPGIGSPCKCDQKGDDSFKFYGDNWKARGTVCDGGYIPSGVDLKGIAGDKVLEWMSDITVGAGGVMPKSEASLRSLARMAVERAGQ